MTDFAFPPGFLWGSSTAAHQVEGNNIQNDWWAWEQAGKVKEPSGLACDHYHRFESDFDLAVSLGHNAHRFSIEWARIEPTEGQWDDEALAHYVSVVHALRQRHLEPLVTLHHFTSPQWLAAQGGWLNPKAVDRFARYVQRVAHALGDAVQYWITINEPMVYIRMHYIQGLGPPGAKDFMQGMTVIEHLVRAHAAAYQVLHSTPATAKSHVGLAHHFPVMRPCRPWWPLDRKMALMTDRLFNVALLEAVTEGRWELPGVKTWTVEPRHTLDFLGVNFYGRQFIRWVPWLKGWPAQACDLGHHSRDVSERTSLGWDAHPEALFEALMRLAAVKRPLIITENGTYMTDDARRWRFIHGHLRVLADAMKAGAPVKGYCYWSLLDNFEWAEGYGPRFGLIEVDYATQERRIRDSARRYAEICRTNQLAPL